MSSAWPGARPLDCLGQLTRSSFSRNKRKHNLWRASLCSELATSSPGSRALPFESEVRGQSFDRVKSRP